MDINFVSRIQTTVPQLAATLVHEATHARLFGCGIRYAEPTRRRIEAICVAESAAFARRLPKGETLARELQEALPTDDNHWSNDTLDRRILNARLLEVDELEIPEWLKRILRRVVRSRAA